MVPGLDISLRFGSNVVASPLLPGRTLTSATACVPMPSRPATLGSGGSSAAPSGAPFRRLLRRPRSWPPSHRVVVSLCPTIVPCGKQGSFIQVSIVMRESPCHSRFQHVLPVHICHNGPGQNKMQTYKVRRRFLLLTKSAASLASYDTVPERMCTDVCVTGCVINPNLFLSLSACV